MKNIIKIIVVVFIVISEASAQKSYREIDIALKKVAPIEIPFIKCPAIIDLKLKIINNSLDTIYATDSIDGLVYFPVSLRFKLPINRIVIPGDSFIFDLKVNLDDYAFDSDNFSFSVFGLLVNPEYYIKREDQTTWTDNQVYYNNIVIRTKTSSNNTIKTIDFFCYPNPFNNRIYFNEVDLAHNKANTVVVFDINGRELYNDSYLKEEGINTEDWLSGMYFYQITTENGTSIQGKLIKQ